MVHGDFYLFFSLSIDIYVNHVWFSFGRIISLRWFLHLKSFIAEGSVYLKPWNTVHQIHWRILNRFLLYHASSLHFGEPRSPTFSHCDNGPCLKCVDAIESDWSARFIGVSPFSAVIDIGEQTVTPEGLIALFSWSHHRYVGAFVLLESWTVR